MKKLIQNTLNNDKKFNGNLGDIDRGLGEISKELETLQKEENTVFNRIRDTSDNLGKIYEYNYMVKTQDVDILINIAVTLFSISLSLLIAYVSIPKLEGNSVPALIVVFFSSVILIILMLYRNKTLSMLKKVYLNEMITNTFRLNTRTTKDLDAVQLKRDSLQTKLKTVHDNINDLKEKLKVYQSPKED